MLRLCFVLSAFVVLQHVVSDDMYNKPTEARNYFSELGDDMTKVTWVHRCNSRAKLEAALKTDVMMIEADIISGHLTGDGGGPPIPVMGHPPDTTGDLSLEQFLDFILQRNDVHKGIKLDFKSLAAFKASEDILEQFMAKPEVDFPVWVNADIVKGPGHERLQKDVVEPNYFLKTCVTKFPIATISPGWTVDASSAKTLMYNTTHVDEMTTLLAENKVVHPVTFPVHAGIASNSKETLKSLIHSSLDGATLTLWAGQGEWVDYDQLRQLIESVGKDKVFVDMPQEMMDKLMGTSSQESKGTRVFMGSAAFILISLVFLF